VYEIDLPSPEFAQFLVAQSAVQIHHEGGVASFIAFSRRDFARIRSPWPPQSRDRNSTSSWMGFGPVFSANRPVW
jgi:hypothetical protein